MSKIEDIISQLISAYPGVGTFDFPRNCMICGKKMNLVITLKNTEDADGKPGVECRITGGAGFGFDIKNPNVFKSMKCGICYQKHGEIVKYSRVVGYYSPISNWHKAKQAEFRKRALFKGLEKL